MSKQQTQVATIALPSENNNSIDINYIKKYLYHWPLFLLGVILAIALAWYYIKITSPVYPVVATLKFKVPTASSMGIPNVQTTMVHDLDPISKPVIVENEIEVMQSKKLMFQVVNELQLWVSYVQKEGHLKPAKDLYKISPVKFEFLKQAGTISPQGEKLKITISNKNSFILEDADGNTKKVKFSTPVNGTFGAWQLLPTANVGNYIDSTLLVTVQDPDLVADSYQKSLKVSLNDKDAPFVDLAINDIVPQRGKDILNLLLQLYQKAALNDKSEDAEKTLAFIDLRLDSVLKNLDTVDRKMANYKSTQGLINVKNQGDVYQQRKLDNIQKLHEIDQKLKAIEVFDSYFNTSSKNDKLPAINNADFGDIDLSNIYQELDKMLLQRKGLLNSVGAKSPLVSSLDDQISILQNSFKDKIRAIKSSSLATRQQLMSYDNSFENTLKNIPNQDKEYNAIDRDQVTKEKLYTDLLSLREQVSLRYGSAVSDSEIVDDAHAGKVKWPMAPVVYGLALIIGLVVPVGLLYARESFGAYITTRYQIENETGVPILGELAYQDTKTPIVVTGGRNKFAVGEQFRVLRTNLYHLHDTNEKGRVTLVTSSVGGEGKSFVSSNLAVTLAFADRKTVLLEMDLRKPKVSVNFGLSPDHPGIGNYLTGQSSDIPSLVQPSGIPGLDIMSCGEIVPNPSELLERNKLNEMIAALKAIYDDILIDTPPIHLVTDAVIISRTVDASLYVVRQGFTSRHELEFISELNKKNRFPKLNIVFNGITSNKYGYGYNYGNSYYNAYNTEKGKSGFGSKMRGFLRRF